MAGFEIRPLGLRFGGYRIAHADPDRQTSLEETRRRSLAREGAQPAGPPSRKRVRRAMEFLRLRYGNWTGVAKAMGYHRVTIERVLNLRRTATTAFALRVAKKLGVTLGDVLSGARPKAGECPMCGTVVRGASGPWSRCK